MKTAPYTEAASRFLLCSAGGACFRRCPGRRDGPSGIRNHEDPGTRPNDRFGRLHVRGCEPTRGTEKKISSELSIHFEHSIGKGNAVIHFPEAGGGGVLSKARPMRDMRGISAFFRRIRCLDAVQPIWHTDTELRRALLHRGTVLACEERFRRGRVIAGDHASGSFSEISHAGNL